MRFGLDFSESGVLAALKRYGISWKKLTKMDKRAFSAEIRELTTTFLFCRLGLDKRHGVWVDEMYKAEHVGSQYGYASASRRAIQVDDGRGSGDAVMFITAMTDTKVLPITLPVMQPVTVTGWLFETWCEHFLIPQMLLEGKTLVCMDNARPHRHRVLRGMFFLAE